MTKLFMDPLRDNGEVDVRGRAIKTCHVFAANGSKEALEALMPHINPRPVGGIREGRFAPYLMLDALQRRYAAAQGVKAVDMREAGRRLIRLQDAKQAVA